ncbi:MAG TPA: hypothetical protein VEO02_09675 [Thermoanaerobaculia bacterium]|nr:hypothetical protein [Thermoanaerobaculia bacterium]
MRERHHPVPQRSAHRRRGRPVRPRWPEEIARAAQTICGFDPDLSLGLTVSLDGFRAYHDHVRKVTGLYDRAIATLENLLALARATPNLTVGVTTVFMHDN